jgi:hypothetical protein
MIAQNLVTQGTKETNAAAAGDVVPAAIRAT